MKRQDQRKLKLNKVALRQLNEPSLSQVNGGNGYHSSCGVPCGCEPDPFASFLYCAP